MQTEQTNCVRKLEAGQLWKLEHGYVQILELGARHVYYKMLRQPEQKAALTRMIGIEAMLRFLQTEAFLVAPFQDVEQRLAEGQAVEQVTSAGQRPGNGLMLGLLGQGAAPRPTGAAGQLSAGTSLACLCSRGLNQWQSLLGQVRHPA